MRRRGAARRAEVTRAGAGSAPVLRAREGAGFSAAEASAAPEPSAAHRGRFGFLELLAPQPAGPPGLDPAPRASRGRPRHAPSPERPAPPGICCRVPLALLFTPPAVAVAVAVAAPGAGTRSASWPRTCAKGERAGPQSFPCGVPVSEQRVAGAVQCTRIRVPPWHSGFEPLIFTPVSVFYYYYYLSPLVN